MIGVSSPLKGNAGGLSPNLLAMLGRLGMNGRRARERLRNRRVAAVLYCRFYKNALPVYSPSENELKKNKS